MNAAEVTSGHLSAVCRFAGPVLNVSVTIKRRNSPAFKSSKQLIACRGRQWHRQPAIRHHTPPAQRRHPNLHAHVHLDRTARTWHSPRFSSEKLVFRFHERAFRQPGGMIRPVEVPDPMQRADDAGTFPSVSGAWPATAVCAKRVACAGEDPPPPPASTPLTMTPPPASTTLTMMSDVVVAKWWVGTLCVCTVALWLGLLMSSPCRSLMFDAAAKCCPGDGGTNLSAPGMFLGRRRGVSSATGRPDPGLGRATTSRGWPRLPQRVQNDFTLGIVRSTPECQRPIWLALHFK